MSESGYSRRQDLEGHIREALELIRQYEDIFRLSDDPKEKVRARRNIQEQWELVDGYLDEYLPLCTRLQHPIPPDIAEVAATRREVPPAIPGEVPSDWSSVFDRIRRGTYTSQDTAAVMEGLRRGILSITTGERSVAVGGDIEDTVIVTGDGSTVYVFRGRMEGEALREALGSRSPCPEAAFFPNPFTDTLAVRDPSRFVGRKGAMERLLRDLQSHSIALIGERKVGKSSLLWQLKGRLEQDANRVVLFWDFFEPLPAKRLLREAVSRLGGEGDDWEAFRERIHNRRVVLLLDELDLALERGFDLDMLRGCRARTQEETGFRVVTASRTRPRDIFKSEVGSWPYDFLIPTTLDPFTEEEAWELLAHPWAPEVPCFDEAACRELIALTRCHPYRLQRAAHHRYEALVDPTYDWRAAYEREMEALE